MGFQVNLQKSQLEPQTTLQSLGILWHLQTGHWQASQNIREKIMSSTRQLLHTGRITRRRLEALVGFINFACQVHSQLRVYLQPLTVGASLASPQDSDFSPRQRLLSPHSPSTPPGATILGRSQHLGVRPSLPGHSPSLPRLFLWTDDSRLGWGALLHSQATAHAPWRPLEAALHINVLELRAVSRAISAFNLSSCHLVVYTDNETIRFALMHLCACSLPLREELKSLLHDSIRRQVFLHSLCIPTTLNVVADGLSRLKPLNTEWTLPPEAFSAILRWAGPLQVDLLVSLTNYRLPQWVSLFPHPDAVACNCLSIDWNGFASIYAFPLVGLIPTLLPLIRGYRCRLDLVAPWDPQAPWLPFLLQQARDHLHLRTTPFQFCGRGQVFHRLGTSARWTEFFFFAKGPLSFPSSCSGWYSFSELPSLLSTSAGSCMDGLSSLVTSGPLDGHQRRRPCLPVVPFSSKSLAPTTILNYRAALQWPLEEAFLVNFSHPDFSRFATGRLFRRSWFLPPGRFLVGSLRAQVSPPWPLRPGYSTPAFLPPSLSPSWVLLSDHSGPGHLPLAVSLTPFGPGFHVAPWFGMLFTFSVQFWSFSRFFRVPPGSCPSCGSFILGIFARLAFRGVGTRAPRVIPPPTGTFRLLETRHLLTIDWRKYRL